MPEIKVFPSLEALSAAAADETARLIQQYEGPFALVLSGGSTPRTYHAQLVHHYRVSLPWERVHLFWGDERYVPHDHADSNYHMAKETLIEHVPVPPENVHAIPTDAESPEEAAQRYGEMVQTFLRTHGKDGFDLTLLGMGDDGHTASLFPNTPALAERKQPTAAVQAPSYASPRDRITLTFPLLNQSRHVFFLVSGAKKRQPLQQILDRPDEARASYPAARIQAAEGITWYLDEAAYGGHAESDPTR